MFSLEDSGDHIKHVRCGQSIKAKTVPTLRVSAVFQPEVGHRVRQPLVVSTPDETDMLGERQSSI